jgi:hypothetical protein
MHSYYAYGLNLRSVLPLPELLPGAGAADARIRLGEVDGMPAEARARKAYARADAATAYLFWQEVGAFRITGGNEITVEPATGVEERVLRLFLLGPALALLLSQRGLLVLHASAVAIEGRAVAFLGESGHGKSTTAAAFHARGHPVVADDAVAVQIDDGCPMVYPGFPQLKLWPEVAAALGDSAESLPQLRPDLPKRGRDVRHRFAGERLPLATLYVLADGPRLRVEPLRSSEAIIEVVRHTYAARFLHALGPSGHFRQCAALAQSARARRLHRPRSLDQLPALVSQVETDITWPSGASDRTTSTPG